LRYPETGQFPEAGSEHPRDEADLEGIMEGIMEGMTVK
jgi:hypothetical protein